jgi:thioredoxin-like negative regulator of GroEL
MFTDMPFAEALERARTEKRWLLVDATAVWCGPCQQMERTTWKDPMVLAWVAEHAIAVQIDVDKQADVAAQLEIAAMPTMILFRDGREGSDPRRASSDEADRVARRRARRTNEGRRGQ